MYVSPTMWHRLGIICVAVSVICVSPFWFVAVLTSYRFEKCYFPYCDLQMTSVWTFPMNETPVGGREQSFTDD